MLRLLGANFAIGLRLSVHENAVAERIASVGEGNVLSRPE
jgi:hypothetical protein